MTLAGNGQRRVKGRSSDFWRRATFAAAKRILPAFAVDDRGMRFYVEHDDYEIGYNTFRFGTYELETMSTALGLVEQETGRSLKGRGFIDVGANIGTTIVPACKLFGAVQGVAVEASRRNVRQLRVNLAANDLADAVDVVAAAASNELGELELELSREGNLGDNRIRVSSGGGEWDENERQTETVNVVTLDSLTLPDDPAVLWIDTQGHEGHVLAGASRLSDVPTVLEYWPYALDRACGRELLHQVLVSRFSALIDVRETERAGRPVKVTCTPSGLDELARRYEGAHSYTDLVGIP